VSVSLYEGLFPQPPASWAAWERPVEWRYQMENYCLE